MIDNLIPFPKAKKPRGGDASAHADLAEACAAGAARGLIDLADDIAAARESGKRCPISGIAGADLGKH